MRALGADEAREAVAGAAPDLTGRVACVTGASSGLGRTVATALAVAGARVVGVARRAEALEGWAAELSDAAMVSGDLADLAGVPALAGEIAGPFGPPDILVNAAGLNPRRPADEIALEDWRRTLDVNLSAPFLLARALVPAMRERGWGRIVNFASLQTVRAMPDGIAYGAAKGGVGQLTRAMAEAWSRHGIGVNALAPGFFPTELTGPVFADDAAAEALAARTCVGRNGAHADLVGPALFLCSPASDYVTGQVLFVDGGFTAR